MVVLALAVGAVYNTGSIDTRVPHPAKLLSHEAQIDSASWQTQLVTGNVHSSESCRR